MAASCGQPTCLDSLEGGEPRPLSGVEGARAPLAWGEGGILFLREGQGVPARLFRLDLATGRVEPWRELAPLDRSGVLGIGSIVVTADGRALAYNYARQLSDLYVVHGLE